MCGDGTNDVGALKHADVGVALLSAPRPETAPPMASPVAIRDQGSTRRRPNSNSNAKANGSMSRANGTTPRANGALPNKALSPGATSVQRTLQQMKEEMEAEAAANIVQFGDASIAAPF